MGMESKLRDDRLDIYRGFFMIYIYFLWSI